MELSLYKLFFYFKNWEDARKYLMGCISLIDVDAPTAIKPILPDTINTSCDSVINSLKNWGDPNNNRNQMCISLCIALLYYFNGELRKSQKQLVELQSCLSKENDLPAKLSDGFLYAIRIYVAVLLDSWKYGIKVAFNPLCWFSSKRREKCMESCVYLETERNAHSVNKQERAIIKEWKSQIKGCIEVCDEIAKSV